MSDVELMNEVVELSRQNDLLGRVAKALSTRVTLTNVQREVLRQIAEGQEMPDYAVDLLVEAIYGVKQCPVCQAPGGPCPSCVSEARGDGGER